MMKSYKEMAESVLNSVNEYKIRRNIRNEILRKAIPLCCLCVLLAAGGIFWGMGGYSYLSPANTEEESKVTSTESGEPDVFATETNDPLHISVSGQGDYTRWIPYRYENGYVYFKYTCFDNVSDMETAKTDGKNRVLENMTSEEIQQWENYLDIETMLFSAVQGYFSTLGDSYKALLKKEPKDGEPIFDLYRDQVDCYYDNNLLSETADISIKDGMILKAHIFGALQTEQPDKQPSPEDILKALDYGGIYETSTVGGLKNKLSFLDRNSIKIYEVIPVDLKVIPIPTKKSEEHTDENSNFMGAYGIYIECDYMGETYAVEYTADGLGSPCSFKMTLFSPKRNLR